MAVRIIEAAEKSVSKEDFLDEYYYTDEDKLYDYLADNGYRLIRAIYKDANHNRQSYQYIFYNGKKYCNFYRIGRNSDIRDNIKFSNTEPRLFIDSISKISSYDYIHDSEDEPWKFDWNTNRMRKHGIKVDFDFSTKPDYNNIPIEDILLKDGWEKSHNFNSYGKFSQVYYAPKEKYNDLFAYIDAQNYKNKWTYKISMDSREIMTDDVDIQNWDFDSEADNTNDAIKEFRRGYNEYLKLLKKSKQ